jgi:hypothetical protein
VWSEATNDGRAFISYAQLKDGAWTQANEITTSPSGQTATYPTLAADSQGYLHLVWSGDANLLYSQAYGFDASRSKSWSSPVALEYAQNYIGRPHLQIDSRDVLYLAYPIMIGENSGIYVMKSSERGQNWSDPVIVYKNKRSDRMVDMPRLAVGPEGTLHLIWVESNYPESFPPIGIRYTRSSDGGATWSEPISLADGSYGFPAILARDPDEVHVVYSGTTTDRFKFHTWSADGGITWKESFRNSEVGGFQGLPVLVEDSAKTLHWLMTASVFKVGNDCLYHTTWREQAWSPGETLLCGVVRSQNPWDVTAAVALGNQLEAAVQYPLDSSIQPEGWQYEIYILGEELTAPGLQTSPLASPTPLPPTPLPTNASPPTGAHPTLPADLTQISSKTSSPLIVIGGSTLVALAMVVIILGLASRKRL